MLEVSTGLKMETHEFLTQIDGIKGYPENEEFPLQL